jgi:two-component system chemotaxis response regulator CheB
MIRVLIVEDSGVARELLNRILSSDPDIRVVGQASNGFEALELVERTSPDVVTMDIIMPKMGGLEATRRIMETTPIPVVIVSASLNREEVEKTWLAMEAGAVAVLEKPRFSAINSAEATKLVQTVKLMSQVKLVRRWKKTDSKNQTTTVTPKKVAPKSPAKLSLVVIGASTGGPPVLQSIFKQLPGDYPVPILLVQHITRGFTVGFTEWLDRGSDLAVRIARHNETALAGHVYVAPDGFHMTINSDGRILLVPEREPNALVPSVARLFKSVAESFGSSALGVLLTGMGKDGAEELRLMRDQGATTIAQDAESSVVYGMPCEAVKLGAAQHSLSPDQIARMLLHLARDLKIRN